MNPQQLVTAGLALFIATAGAAPEQHFHPKGKAPSQYTKAVLADARAALPFSDKRDFEEQRRGFIAAPKSRVIKDQQGNVVFDLQRFNFIDQANNSDSIHPSLVRQSQLNMSFGLYQVMEDVYQVRGFDLANITFVRGESGWIVFDPLTSQETSSAALDLISQEIAELPVKAVVFSHSHGDHWGGVRGVVSEQDVRSGKVPLIAPVGFTEHAVSENVYAGNAMTRRMYYQYGVALPASPYGHAGQGLAQTISRGTVGLITPSRFVSEAEETIIIDGVKMVFQLTPGTEAPTEMNTYFPDKKLLWAAENVTGTFHNIYTLRGAQVRDALAWSKYINEMLYEYGQEAEIMMASHHWPRWGNERIQEVLRGQRDLYANINNQVLHLANQGVTINQIHNEFETPKSLSDQWYNRGYHGSPEHNSRGVINRYLGYWDNNPATLIPLSPSDSAPLYVEMMGGAKAILRKGKSLHDSGQYKLAVEILDKLLQAEPSNTQVHDLLADCYEQLGYQQENPGLRNSFLQGAYELRDGIKTGFEPNTASEEIISALPTELFFDALAIRMDAAKVDGLNFVINFATPDTGETFVIELSNATLTTIAGQQAVQPDLSYRINRSDLVPIMMQRASFASQLKAGRASAEGDVQILAKMLQAITVFPTDFEILPGTKRD
ncbi:alkyl/aryl-sulfatase [Ferrimonas lipolytica]|uniref:MBL fold metallo-hydrolase n=1 Tax=Ferrimonas lipolytica TaxID=2724191 RepID=A0A6H1UC82_9GAMM|nr:alkyl sulfatase dimerization domain-containing protein [Ferrimonas lipolytica]QIZ75816.1 MBL fold metallo-hydrolase [Ferrimonas lipolytica]